MRLLFDLGMRRGHGRRRGAASLTRRVARTGLYPRDGVSNIAIAETLAFRAAGGAALPGLRNRPERFCPVALHATTIRFADRSYVAIARAADAQGISVSQYVREAALIRAVLDELDTAEEALHSAHDLLAVAREVRQLAQVDPPGPPRPDSD